MAAARRVAVALLLAADLAAGLTAITTININYAVYRWIEYRSSAESEYGHISTWDTSGVTDMRYLFCGRSYSYCGSKSYFTSSAYYFNDDISAWDVSRVTTMYYMFYYAYDFNQDLSGWNIRDVASMYHMFYYAYDFNQNLGWCVENGVSTNYMFYNTGCGGTYTTTTAMSRCGVTQQSYCAPPPTPTPTPAAKGFTHVNIPYSYSSALSYCRSYHVDLASIHSSIENAAVAALCPNDCWIGGSDEASEGTWTWSDGSAWNYQNWKSGEPSTSSSSYDYLAIRSAGEWYATYYAYSGSKTFVCSTTTPPSSSSSSDKGKDQEDNTGVVVGIFCALALAAAWGFHVYRNKKIKRSRGLKREIKRMNSELNTYKNAAVGMRVAVTAAGPSAPAAGPITWYWEESSARLELHPIVKEPHWIPYDAATTSLLESNHQRGLGPVKLSAAYEADTKAMTQKNVRTNFSRKLLRFEPPASKGAAPPPKPADIAADEPCLILDPGAIMLIAKQRDDGWAFGSLVMESDATSPSSPGPGWSKNQGWFRMENTDIPTVDQLAEFRDAVEGGEDALAPPKYWDDVKDPTVVEYFRITSKTHADEYERVLGAFMLTLNPSAFKIHSVDRVQNLSLWKTYAAKRRFVRAWLFHGCSTDLAPKILQQGFNRSFCGKHNTLYGKGVYFARDASYSTYPLYCTPDAKEIQTVFLVRVVVGEYCKGYKHAVTPDVRNAAKNQLYDSTVDNVRDPSIFVTYHDAQAYPEYCIKFTQLKSSVPKEHPSANKPAHRLYRRNLVLDVD